MMRNYKGKDNCEEGRGSENEWTGQQGEVISGGSSPVRRRSNWT